MTRLSHVFRKKRPITEVNVIEVCFDWLSVGVITKLQSYHDNIVWVLRKVHSVEAVFSARLHVESEDLWGKE